MRLLLIIIISFTCLPLISNAQKDIENSSINKNSVYLEVGGSGLWYSINYDRILFKREHKALSVRAGISYLGDFSDTNAITIPISASFLYGRNKNFLEVGGGPTTLHSFAESITGVGAIGIIGFRHQHTNNKGLMYRIVFNPFLVEYSTDKGYWNWVAIPWAGISLGYTF
ncbi:MAG: hypothetical protein P1U41_09970 [Vicingaceae bacterium]|nr:hypothetical protein [Vicingaceae bacterium]